MVVENKKIKKIYSFYVSEFHLEMILVPFIDKKLKANEKVMIKTEYDFNDTLKLLLSKINLNENEKTKILDLNWNNRNDEKIEDDTNVIIIGSKEYIKNINNEINKNNFNNITVVDCYKFDDIENNIVSKYDKSLNTTGLDNI